jgi:phosphate:Na+ symporter
VRSSGWLRAARRDPSAVLAGESVTYNPPAEGSEQIDHFLESLSLETTDLETVGPRLVRLCHTLDHLGKIHDDLTHIPPAVNGWQPPGGFEAAAQALARWLNATKGPQAAADPAIFKALEAASKQLNEERKTGREKLLEDVALQRIPTATARASLDTLVWADLALYHSWRLAESLKIASGK